MISLPRRDIFSQSDSLEHACLPETNSRGRAKRPSGDRTCSGHLLRFGAAHDGSVAHVGRGSKASGQLRSDAGLCPEHLQKRTEFVELGDRWIDPRAKPPCGPSKFSVSGQRVGWMPSALTIVAIWARWRSIEAANSFAPPRLGVCAVALSFSSIALSSDTATTSAPMRSRQVRRQGLASEQADISVHLQLG